MSCSNGTTPLSFDLTSNERVTFGFKQCLGKGIGGNDEESEGSGMNRVVVVGSVDSPHQPTLSKTRSFSDAFAPECLPPLPSSIPKPAFPRTNSEPFPIFPHYSGQVFHDSDEEEEEAEEEIDVLRQYTNLLSPSPERKKQRLHHIASSPPRFDPSPFLTQSTSNSYNFGPFPTGSHDFISTSTTPLARNEDTPMPGADRMRSLSIGTGLDLLSLGGLGGLVPIQLPPPPVIEQSEEPSSPVLEQEEEEEEEDEEEAIPAVLTTISPQEAFTSNLSLHPSPTESRKSVAFVEDPIEVPEDKEEEEEDSSPLSELSSSSSPSPSLSPPPRHGPRFASPLPEPKRSRNEEDKDQDVDTEKEASDQDSLVRRTLEERAQDLVENLSRLLSCPSTLPPGLLELLEASLSHNEKDSNSLAIKLDLLSHSSPRRIFLRPRPHSSPPQRFLPPKPIPRSNRSELKVPKKSHPPYPEPSELGWVYETGLETFEEKRKERNVGRRGGRKVKEEEEEVESEEGGFESDDEGETKRTRGKGRGRRERRGKGTGKGRGRKGRDWDVDSE